MGGRSLVNGAAGHMRASGELVAISRRRRPLTLTLSPADRGEGTGWELSPADRGEGTGWEG
jgi:hypothetical protein